MKDKKTTKATKLNRKRKLFAEEYVKDHNMTQAAIRAGYSERTAYSQGQRLMKNVEIKEYVDQLQAEIRERNKITVDELVETLAAMVRFDIADLYDEKGNLLPINEMSKEARMVIESIESEEEIIGKKRKGVTRKLKLSNKRANIIELMKYFGAYRKDNEQKAQTVEQITVFNLPDNNR